MKCFGHTTVPPQETPEISLTVMTAPVWISEEIVIDWDGCKTDTHCIAWLLCSSTNSDVIYSTVRFATDTIWYPEIARALSPHTLADLFFECLLDGRVVPDKLEHATSIGMALASILSTQHPTLRGTRGRGSQRSLNISILVFSSVFNQVNIRTDYDGPQARRGGPVPSWWSPTVFDPPSYIRAFIHHL